MNVNLGNDEDFAPLMQAACGDEPLLKALLDATADANRASKTGHTALLSAAFANDSEAVKMLVEARAEVNMFNDELQTPLHVAAQ